MTPDMCTPDSGAIAAFHKFLSAAVPVIFCTGRPAQMPGGSHRLMPEPPTLTCNTIGFKTENWSPLHQSSTSLPPAFREAVGRHVRRPQTARPACASPRDGAPAETESSYTSMCALHVVGGLPHATSLLPINAQCSDTVMQAGSGSLMSCLTTSKLQPE